MKPNQSASTGDEAHHGISAILSALAELKFGSVEITVHEGRIVQIERREKQRLNLNVQQFFRNDHSTG
jgi:hypothetical protein